MTTEAVADIAQKALYLIIKVSLPLTFVPKIICVFIALIFFGQWMMNSMVEFMKELWSEFSLYAH